MELRATREMRRNEQLSKTMAKRADTTDVPAKAQPAPRQASADKVSLSQQALSWLEEQNQKRWEQAMERERRRQDRMDGRISGLEEGAQELDALKKALDVLDKCLKIAASVRKGDKVPLEDLEYLQDNDPAGFALALAMRKEKKNPEEVESVLDEEDRNGAVQESGGGESPQVSPSAPAASSGGDASAAAE